nr:MAG TPA: hypothetical protein [Caudoviricetes sp.]
MVDLSTSRKLDLLTYFKGNLKCHLTYLKNTIS